MFDQTPYIGAQVFYRRHGSPNGQHKPEFSPGIVTGFQADGTTSVTVFNPTGLYFSERCEYCADGSKPGHWSWPELVGKQRHPAFKGEKAE